jgi:membrane protein involved in colicin uptake
MDMHRIVVSCGALLLGTSLAGCAEKRPAAAPMEPVSGTSVVLTQATQEEMERLRRERDEARTKLDEERKAQADERRRLAAAEAETKARDALEMRIIEALKKADAEMQQIRDEAPRLTTKQQKDMDQALKAANERRAKLQSDLLQLHGDLGKPFPELREDVDARLQELEDAIRKARDVPKKK